MIDTTNGKLTNTSIHPYSRSWSSGNSVAASDSNTFYYWAQYYTKNPIFAINPSTGLATSLFELIGIPNSLVRYSDSNSGLNGLLLVNHDRPSALVDLKGKVLWSSPYAYLEGALGCFIGGFLFHPA